VSPRTRRFGGHHRCRWRRESECGVPRTSRSRKRRVRVGTGFDCGGLAGVALRTLRLVPFARRRAV